MPTINQYMKPAEYTPQSMFAALPLDLMQQNLQRKQDEIDSSLSAAYKLGKGFDPSGRNTMKGIRYETDETGKPIDYNPDPNKTVPGYQPMYKPVLEDMNIRSMSAGLVDDINEELKKETNALVEKIYADRLNPHKYIGALQDLSAKRQQYASTIERVKGIDKTYEDMLKGLTDKEYNPTQLIPAYKSIGKYAQQMNEYSNLGSSSDRLKYANSMADLSQTGPGKYYDIGEKFFAQGKGFRESGTTTGLGFPMPGFYSSGKTHGVSDDDVRRFGYQWFNSNKEADNQLSLDYEQLLLDGYTPRDIKYEYYKKDDKGNYETDKDGNYIVSKTIYGEDAYKKTIKENMVESLVNKEGGIEQEMSYHSYDPWAKMLNKQDWEKTQRVNEFLPQKVTPGTGITYDHKGMFTFTKDGMADQKKKDSLGWKDWLLGIGTSSLYNYVTGKTEDITPELRAKMDAYRKQKGFKNDIEMFDYIEGVRNAAANVTSQGIIVSKDLGDASMNIFINGKQPLFKLNKKTNQFEKVSSNDYEDEYNKVTGDYLSKENKGIKAPSTFRINNGMNFKGNDNPSGAYEYHVGDDLYAFTTGEATSNSFKRTQQMIQNGQRELMRETGATYVMDGNNMVDVSKLKPEKLLQVAKDPNSRYFKLDRESSIQKNPNGKHDVRIVYDVLAPVIKNGKVTFVETPNQYTPGLQAQEDAQGYAGQSFIFTSEQSEDNLYKPFDNRRRKSDNQ